MILLRFRKTTSSPFTATPSDVDIVTRKVAFRHLFGDNVFLSAAAVFMGAILLYNTAIT